MEGIRDTRPLWVLQSDFNGTAARKAQVEYGDHFNEDEKKRLLSQYDSILERLAARIKARRDEEKKRLLSQYDGIIERVSDRIKARMHEG